MHRQELFQQVMSRPAHATSIIRLRGNLSNIRDVRTQLRTQLTSEGLWPVIENDDYVAWLVDAYEMSLVNREAEQKRKVELLHERMEAWGQEVQQQGAGEGGRKQQDPLREAPRRVPRDAEDDPDATVDYNFSWSPRSNRS